jgi:hypothetical protein
MSRGPGHVERAVKAALRDEPLTYEDLARHVYGDRTRAQLNTIGQVALRLARRDEAQLWVIRTVVPAQRSRAYSMSTRVRGLSLPLPEHKREFYSRELALLKLYLERAREYRAMPPLPPPVRPPLGGKKGEWEREMLAAYEHAQRFIEAAEGRIAESNGLPIDDIKQSLSRPLPILRNR